MNIIIMRAFIRMREMIASNKDFAARIEALERGHDRTASVIEILVEDIDRLAHTVKEMKALPPVTKRKIGYVLDQVGSRGTGEQFGLARSRLTRGCWTLYLPPCVVCWCSLLGKKDGFRRQHSFSPGPLLM